MKLSPTEQYTFSTMAYLLNHPGDIKADPVDASKATVIRPTEKDIPLPEVKMHLTEDMLVELYHMDSEIVYQDGLAEEDGRVIKTTDDFKVRIHDMTTMKVITEFDTGHTRGIRRVILWDGAKPNGPQIITASNDGRIRVFDLKGKLMRKLEKPDEGTKNWEKIGHVGKVLCIAAHKDEPYEDTLVVSGGEDKTVRIWSLKGGKQIAECKGHESHVTGVCFCTGRGIKGKPEKLAASMDFKGEIRFWNIETGELRRIISEEGAKEEKYF